MNSNEEFNNYCLHQINDEESRIYFDESKLKVYSEERKNNIINNDDKNFEIKRKINKSTSKRLRSLPKTYHTYTILFKKQVIEEVNLNL